MAAPRVSGVRGAAYRLQQGTIRGRPQVMGPLFGSGAWASSYAQLVPTGLYRPPWTYSPKLLANDLGHHLTHGVAVAAAYAGHPRALSSQSYRPTVAASAATTR